MKTGRVSAEQLFDLTQMDEVAGGSNDFLAAMSQIYIDTIPALSSKLVEATLVGDWAAASQLAHRLKSTVDSMNMHTIKGDIRAIEMDAKNKVNTVTLQLLALKVDEVIKTVADQLKDDFDL